jgi:hypothetical protein
MNSMMKTRGVCKEELSKKLLCSNQMERMWGKIGVTLLSQGFSSVILNMNVHYVAHHTNLAI